MIRFRQLAMNNRVWLSLGGYPERVPNDPQKRYCIYYLLT